MPSIVLADEAEAEAAEAEAMEAEVVENGEAEAAEPVVPSVTLYGAIRTSVRFGGGDDARYADGTSIWGITGATEVAEGLTGVYKFEHSINSGNASQTGGRHAYFGLSGGFGTVTLGQQGTAAASAISGNDKSNYFGASGLEATRHGNAVSYAFSSGGIGFMADVQMDGGTDTGGHIDKSEIGLTVGVGEFGTLGVGYVNQKDKLTMSPTKYMVDTDGTDDGVKLAEANMIMVKTAKSNVDDKGMLKSASITDIKNDNGMYSAGTCSATKTDGTMCTNGTAYSHVDTSTATGGGDVNVSESYYTTATKTGGKKVTAEDGEGYKATHVRYEFGVGGLTSWVGHSQKKVNGAAKKSKTTHFGLTGAMGDTGLSFTVMGRRVKAADGESTNPWLFNINRSLGGGASVHLEHANDDNDESGTTAVGLNVAF